MKRMKMGDRIWNKTAGTPLDTTLLVFMALALAGGTLLIFYLHGGYVSSRISDSRFLDGTYIRENQINFYIDEMMGKSIAKINDKSNPLPEFIDNFKNELAKYKSNGSYVLMELGELEDQITQENIQFIDGRIIFSVSINIKQDFEEKFSSNYNYNRVFEKQVFN